MSAAVLSAYRLDENLSLMVHHPVTTSCSSAGVPRSRGVPISLESPTQSSYQHWWDKNTWRGSHQTWGHYTYCPGPRLWKVLLVSHQLWTDVCPHQHFQSDGCVQDAVTGLSGFSSWEPRLTVLPRQVL